MGAVIGDLLPLAIGVAISPLPVTAVILMLLSPRAAVTSGGFLVGWVTSILIVTLAALVLVGEAADAGPGKPSTVSSVLKVTFGALLLTGAVWQWRQRPRPGKPAAMPRWMTAIDSLTLPGAAGLGFLVSGPNPKNLLMCLGAGTTIGAAHLSVPADVICVAVFTALACSTVGAPVICYLFARKQTEGRLDEVRGWLIQNNAVVVAAVLLVIGVVLVGKGITGLTA